MHSLNSTNRWWTGWLRALSWVGLAPPPPQRWLRQAREDNCGQTVVSMLSGVPVEVVQREVEWLGVVLMPKLLALLARYGVPCRPIRADMVSSLWPHFRRSAGGARLRGIAWTGLAPGRSEGHAYLLYGRWIYDPKTGDFTPLNARTIRQMKWVAFAPAEG